MSGVSSCTKLDTDTEFPPLKSLKTIDSLCRTCLKVCSNLTPLFSVLFGGEPMLAEILTSFTNIKFDENVAFPMMICATCADIACEAYRFKIKCETSEIILQNYLKYRLGRENESSGDDQSVSSHGDTIITTYEMSVCDEDIQTEAIPEQNKLSYIEQRDAFVQVSLECFLPIVSEPHRYICRKCRWDCKTEEKYVNHMTRFHYNAKMDNLLKDGQNKLKGMLVPVYKCEICSFSTIAEVDFNSHLVKHYGYKPYKCMHCSFSTYFKPSLLHHQKIHTNIKTHVMDRPHACDECHYRSCNKRQFDNHRKVHCKKFKQFKCEVCPFASSNHLILLAHRRNHSAEKRYKCEKCDYATALRQNLQTHAAKHSSFACDKCNFRGACDTALKRHMVCHSQDKPFCCLECNYKAKTNAALKKHLKLHTENINIESSNK